MAAGQGFKTFTTGEVLTAADVNGYLMQGINVFASSAARSAAITSPQEGQYSFLKDTNALEYYDGAAWVGAPVGDITAVTAGTGISGGGSSGAVTITNSMATEISAKGDLIVGTGSQTFDNLTVGANNTVLTADSSTATGLKWATAAGGGATVAAVRKSADQSVTSSTTIANDTHLKFAIGANETYTFNLWLYTSAANSTPGIKWNVAGPSGSTVFFSPPNTYPMADGATVIATIGSSTDTFQGFVDGNLRPILIQGTILNGSTAGDVQLKWAQNTSSATATTVKAGSFIYGIKVS
jgi:hypothetical protein